MSQSAAVNKWLVTGTMSLISLMVLLDMTIANVASAVLGQSGSRKFHRLQGSQQSIFRAILPLKKEKTA